MCFRKSSAKSARDRAKKLLDRYKGTTTEKVVSAGLGGGLVPVIDRVLGATTQLTPMVRNIIIAGGATLSLAMDNENAVLDYMALGAIGKVSGDVVDDAMAGLGLVAAAGAIGDFFAPAALVGRGTTSGQQVAVRALSGGRGLQALVNRRDGGASAVQQAASSAAFQGF